MLFQANEETGEYTLQARRSSSAKHDLPMWGKVLVYDSTEDAEASVGEDERDEQRVRLVQIGTNKQLRLALEPETESCRGCSALYLRLAPTCPLYWTKWDMEKDNADLDILCAMPHKGSRQLFLQSLRGGENGPPVKARLTRNKTPAPSGAVRRQLIVYPEGRVVGAPDFGASNVMQT